MEESLDKAKRIGEIERKICDGESLLRRIENNIKIGWLFIFVGLALIVLLDLIWKILGLLLIGASIILIINNGKNEKQVDEGLRDYRGQKAELLAELLILKK